MDKPREGSPPPAVFPLWASSRSRPSDDVLLAHRHMNQIPHYVQQSHMRLLDAVNAEAWHREAIIRHLRHPPAVFAGEGDGQQSLNTCGLERIDEIRRLSAGGDRQGHIVFFGPQLNLIDEDARK